MVKNRKKGQQSNPLNPFLVFNNKQKYLRTNRCWHGSLSKIGPIRARPDATRLGRLEPVRQLAEDIGNLWANEHQNGDDDNGDQDEDQRVLDETLTFFARQIHAFSPPPLESHFFS